MKTGKSDGFKKKRNEKKDMAFDHNCDIDDIINGSLALFHAVKFTHALLCVAFS